MPAQPRVARGRGGQARGVQRAEKTAGSLALALHERHAPVVCQTAGVAQRRQPKVGVVLPQEQAVFAAAGHHAVGLVRALDHQVVHHHADVAHVAGQDERLAPKQRASGVDARQNPLRGGLLVAGGAVDLPGEVQPRHAPALQREAQLGGVDAVVLDGVGQAREHAALQPPHRAVHGPLHAFGQAGAHALHIPFRAGQPLRLQKELVAVLVGKAAHLVLDAGAVARAGALDVAADHGGEVQVFPDDAVRFLVGVGQVAHRAVAQRKGHARVRIARRGQEGKGHDGVVAGLGLHEVKVDGAHVHAGGRAGLEAPEREAQPLQRARQTLGAQKSLRSAVFGIVPDDDAAFEVYAAADHARPAGDDVARHGANAADPPAPGENVHRLGLAHGQPRGGKQNAQHVLVVAALVGLGAQAVHGRTLGAVEHAALQERAVDAKPHLPAQRVHLTYKVALARAADGGVAGHQGHASQVQSEQQGFHAHARGGQRRLASRVPRANDDEVVHDVPS